MNAPERSPIRFTEYSHGGGCGCPVFRNEGFFEAGQIGHFAAGAPVIDLK
jgi:hypothetical protein